MTIFIHFSPKEHGTCSQPVMRNLKWGCDYNTADRICCFNRHYAEHAGYWLETNFLNEVLSALPLMLGGTFIPPTHIRWTKTARQPITILSRGRHFLSLLGAAHLKSSSETTRLLNFFRWLLIDWYIVPLSQSGVEVSRLAFLQRQWSENAKTIYFINKNWFIRPGCLGERPLLEKWRRWLD